MSLEMSAAAAAVAAAAAASRRSNRRKTLSHADLEDFLCTVGDPEGAAMVVERDAADGAGGACHGNACPSSAGATVPTVVYTDEQRIRDIYKLLKRSDRPVYPTDSTYTRACLLAKEILNHSKYSILPARVLFPERFRYRPETLESKKELLGMLTPMIGDAEKQRQIDSKDSEEFTRCKVGRSKSRAAAFEYTDVDTGFAVPAEEYEKRYLAHLEAIRHRRSAAKRQALQEQEQERARVREEEQQQLQLHVQSQQQRESHAGIKAAVLAAQGPCAGNAAQALLGVAAAAEVMIKSPGRPVGSPRGAAAGPAGCDENGHADASSVPEPSSEPAEVTGLEGLLGGDNPCSAGPKRRQRASILLTSFDSPLGSPAGKAAPAPLAVGTAEAEAGGAPTVVRMVSAEPSFEEMAAAGGHDDEEGGTTEPMSISPVADRSLSSSRRVTLSPASARSLMLAAIHDDDDDDNDTLPAAAPAAGTLASVVSSEQDDDADEDAELIVIDSGSDPLALAGLGALGVAVRDSDDIALLSGALSAQVGTSPDFLLLDADETAAETVFPPVVAASAEGRDGDDDEEVLAVGTAEGGFDDALVRRKGEWRAEFGLGVHDPHAPPPSSSSSSSSSSSFTSSTAGGFAGIEGLFLGPVAAAASEPPSCDDVDRQAAAFGSELDALLASDAGTCAAPPVGPTGPTGPGVGVGAEGHRGACDAGSDRSSPSSDDGDAMYEDEDDDGEEEEGAGAGDGSEGLLAAAGVSLEQVLVDVDSLAVDSLATETDARGAAPLGAASPPPALQPQPQAQGPGGVGFLQRFVEFCQGQQLPLALPLPGLGLGLASPPAPLAPPCDSSSVGMDVDGEDEEGCVAGMDGGAPMGCGDDADDATPSPSPAVGLGPGPAAGGPKAHPELVRRRGGEGDEEEKGSGGDSASKKSKKNTSPLEEPLATAGDDVGAAAAGAAAVSVALDTAFLTFAAPASVEEAERRACARLAVRQQVAYWKYRWEVCSHHAAAMARAKAPSSGSSHTLTADSRPVTN